MSKAAPQFLLAIAQVWHPVQRCILAIDNFSPPASLSLSPISLQEAMMDHPLQTISYIADIGNIVVLMARRKLPRQVASPAEKQLYKMICHVFHSADVSMGQLRGTLGAMGVFTSLCMCAHPCICMCASMHSCDGMEKQA